MTEPREDSSNKFHSCSQELFWNNVIKGVLDTSEGIVAGRSSYVERMQIGR